MKDLIHEMHVAKLGFTDRLARLDPPKPKNHKKFIGIWDSIEACFVNLTNPIREQLYREERREILDAEYRSQPKAKA